MQIFKSLGFWGFGVYQSGLHFIIPSDTPFEVDSLLYITHYLLHQAGIIYDNKSFVD